MPPRHEYEHDRTFKQTGTIPGDLYWQARVVKLGERKEDVDSDNEEAADVPKAVVVIDWYYTYYDIIAKIDRRTVKSCIFIRGISNLGHRERVLSTHRQVVSPQVICDVSHPKSFDDTTSSMPLMEPDDYFIRQGTLSWQGGAATFERNGKICHENCTQSGVYDPSDTTSELRWCVTCDKWFHSCCLQEEPDLESPGDLGQLYLLEDGFDLLARIISRPIRRLSREHDAPLSLEKIQTHLIREWKTGVTSLEDCEIDTVVEDSDVFGGEVPDDWEALIETSLELMGEWKWTRCPSCQSSYI
ncbi:hypothetical protein M413DRAFT_14961 [Hebeloma cylindrosporum]|uniref:BAH domain-containing protein n=1 Tax=Hebeloma cylindrosporum TaxID=76867 RepID=A0A0C3BCW6_HEBCY|nr:hypothetical protein M413DRAFT_14961 [Hebeloma cylindrosporum h7]